MKLRSILAAALACLAASAQAFTESNASLPTFAANPQFADPAAAPWSSFNAGTAPFAFGQKGLAGLPGAQTYSFIQPLGKSVTLGVQTTSGYAPSAFTRGPTFGQDFNATNFQFNYNMGRLTPFLTGSVASTRSNLPGGMNFGLPAFSTPENKNAVSVGAGFNYAVTDKFSFGVAVSAGSAQGFR